MTNETIIANARKAFPNAADDTEALCLMVRYLDGVRAERISAMNLNAMQAGMLARAYSENDRLRAFDGRAA